MADINFASAYTTNAGASGSSALGAASVKADTFLVVGHNEDKTECLTIWEDVSYVDQWLPEPTLVINTVIIASIAATSPALINIIKGITKNIMKKITSSQGSKKNDNASQSD